MSIATRPWDVTEHLDTGAAMNAYLDAALEDGDPALVNAAIADVARVGVEEEAARQRRAGPANAWA